MRLRDRAAAARSITASTKIKELVKQTVILCGLAFVVMPPRPIIGNVNLKFESGHGIHQILIVGRFDPGDEHGRLRREYRGRSVGQLEGWRQFSVVNENLPFAGKIGSWHGAKIFDDRPEFHTIRLRGAYWALENLHLFRISLHGSLPVVPYIEDFHSNIGSVGSIEGILLYSRLFYHLSELKSVNEKNSNGGSSTNGLNKETGFALNFIEVFFEFAKVVIYLCCAFVFSGFGVLHFHRALSARTIRRWTVYFLVGIACLCICGAFLVFAIQVAQAF